MRRTEVHISRLMQFGHIVSLGTKGSGILTFQFESAVFTAVGSNAENRFRRNILVTWQDPRVVTGKRKQEAALTSRAR
jgi:hypothetical protein